MEIWSKVKQKTSAAVSKTKGVAEIVRLKGDINAERDKIEELETAIGRKYYAEHGGNPDADFAAFCADIDSAYAKIAEIKAQIRVIRGVICCPGCGNDVDIDMNFCPICGAKIEHPDVNTEAEPDENTEKTADEQ